MGEGREGKAIQEQVYIPLVVISRTIDCVLARDLFPDPALRTDHGDPRIFRV